MNKTILAPESMMLNKFIHMFYYVIFLKTKKREEKRSKVKNWQQKKLTTK
jgi:hypothetical protein